MNVFEFSRWVERKRIEALAKNPSAKKFDINVFGAAKELNITLDEAIRLMSEYAELVQSRDNR